MPWQQLIIHTSAQKAETLSELLSAHGAQAVTLTDAADQPLFEPPPGTTPLWLRTVVIGLFAQDWPMHQTLQAVQAMYTPQPMPKYHIQPLADQDWERVCLDQFHPMQFGSRLWVCPSWQSPPQPGAANVLLDPGLAFGTGTHPTTCLCLEWLDQNLQDKQIVMDFGCGSGILAIAAIKLGAKHVYALDIDPQALTATRENAEKNAVSNCLSVSLADTMPKKKVDVLLANILAAPLIELAEDLANCVKDGGEMVLSGILRDQADAVIDRYNTWFDISPIAVLDDWVRVHGVKRSRPE